MVKQLLRLDPGPVRDVNQVAGQQRHVWRGPRQGAIDINRLAANTTGTSNTYTSQSSINLDGSQNLILGLTNFVSSGSGFGSLNLTVQSNFGTILSKSFTSLSWRQSYFHDQSIVLGSPDSPVNLTLSMTYTSSTPGSSFGATFLTGNAVPGDTNGDGIVNSQDLALVASNWLQSGTRLSVAGDANGDGIVNSQDLALISSDWLQTPGSTSSSSLSASPVPEPATYLMALAQVSLLWFGGVERHQRAP